MAQTQMHELAKAGQSVWLDYINRSMIESGKLKKLIEDGLRGMTSNPSIFNQVISSSKDYDEKIAQLKDAGKSTFEIYDELTIRDIQDACDLFKPVYETTGRLDGYVSLEINPELANDAEASIKEGQRLFKKVNRPNVMIKVPATKAGFPVIEELLTEGINVNVTLIFSLQQYMDTANAFFKGLERLSKKEKDLSKVRSVASVFVSRIDTMADKMIEDKIKATSDPAAQKQLSALKGKAAVANCKIVYEQAKEFFAGPQFQALAKKNAAFQRVLWGSTSTKNPDYRDVKYVEELIAPDTVNTIPEPTLMAFLDHGQVKDALKGDKKEAAAIHAELKKFDINIDSICQKLLEDGVVAFEKAFADLMQAIETKAKQLCHK